ncbi:MAG: hypothetical protein V4550_04075 [Gemmatimonadota bacterium]
MTADELATPLRLANSLRARNWLCEDASSIELPEHLDEVQVSLIDCPHIDLEQVALIALLIRFIADHGRRLYVRWPENTNEEQAGRCRFLTRIGLPEAIGLRAPEYPWQSRVLEINKLAFPSEGSWEDKQAVRRYLPLTWFDKKSFSYEEPIWEASAYLRSAFTNRLREQLTAGGFLDSKAILTLNTALFNEAAWNAVLHGGNNPGDGWGVMCAHMDSEQTRSSKQSTKIEIVVADLGQGIPQSLGETFEATAPEAIRKRVCSRASMITLFALTPEGSRRPIPHKKRGSESVGGLTDLAYLSAAWGRMRLYSGGGGVEVAGGNRGGALQQRIRVDDSRTHAALPGVQISCSFEAPTASDRVLFASQRQEWANDGDVISAIDALGSWGAITTHEAINDLLSALPNSSGTAIIDLGYAPIDKDSLRTLMRTIHARERKRMIVYWNVAADWALLSETAAWMATHAVANQPPTLVVRAVDDVALLGATHSPQLLAAVEKTHGLVVDAEQSAQKGEAILACALEGGAYNAVTSRCNVAFVARGFDAAGPGAGFYSGKIHLLSGTTRRRFFSLSKNIAVAHGNTVRWAEALYGLLLAGLAEEDIGDDGHLVLVGFSTSIAKVADIVSSRLAATHAHSAINLLSFDAPTQEELRPLVQRDSKVVLLTDAVSTSSLSDSVVAAVERCGAKVVMMAIAVDARAEATVSSCPTSASVTLDPGPASHEGSAKEYWVDPISQIPAASREWDTAIDARIPHTLSLIHSARAVRCGHIVDGARHSEVYVDVKELIDRCPSQLFDTSQAEMRARVSKRGWGDFVPSVLLYPSGIRRIEVMRSHRDVGASRPAYETAVQQLRRLLSPLWKPAGREIVEKEVLRTFDPGGRSRCQAVLEFTEPIAVHPSRDKPDMMVVDDGLSSGRTVRELLRLAAAAGAGRVLVFCLVARLKPRDLEFWESLRVVSSDGGDDVETCVVLPLYLPVSFNDAHTCSYDITAGRLREWANGTDGAAQIARNLLKTVEPQSPATCARRSEIYERSWVRTHVLAELATESQEAIEALRDVIAACENADDADEQLAVLSAFLENWRILGTPRVRQTLARSVERLSVHLLRASDTREDVRLAAVAILRSLFVSSFLEELRDLPNLPGASIALIERATFNAFTLRTRATQSSGIALFLDALQLTPFGRKSAGDERDHDGQRERIVDMTMRLGIACAMTEAPIGMKDRVERADLLMLRDGALYHQPLGQTLQAIARWSRLAPGTIKKETVEITLKSVQEHSRFITRRVLPVIAPLAMLMRDAAGDSDDITMHDGLLYLSTAENLRGELIGDLGSIAFRLEQLQQSPNYPRALTSAAETAEKIYAHLAARDSTIVRFLRSLHEVKVGAVYDLFELKLREYLGERIVVPCVVKLLDDINGSEELFLPKRVMSACLTAICSNIDARAFPNDDYEEPEVQVQVTRRIDSVGSSHIQFAISNNGEPLRRPTRTGKASKRAAAAIALYEGDLSSPYVDDAGNVCVNLVARSWS